MNCKHLSFRVVYYFWGRLKQCRECSKVLDRIKTFEEFEKNRGEI